MALADRVYDVGSNTTFASFPLALAQAAFDNTGPFAVTVRVRAMADNNAPFPPLDINASAYALDPQPGAGLVLEPVPGYAPVFGGSGSAALRVSGIAHVTVQGLIINGSPSDSLRIEAAPDFIVDQVTVQGASVTGINATESPRLIIRHSVLAPASGAGLLLSACADAFISFNLVPATSNPSYGVVVQSSPRAWVDHNNSGGADQAFNVFSSDHVSLTANVAIRRGGNRGIVLDNAPYTYVLKNLLVGQQVGLEALASPNCALVQNTVWDHSTAGLYTRSNCSPLVLRNNLWQGFLALFLDSATEVGLDSDFQGFRFSGQFGLGSSSYPNLATWQAGTLQDAHSLVSDAVFVNGSGQTADDFKLSPSSPMQGTGANLTTQYGYSTDLFEDPLPVLTQTPWDPGIHVVSAAQSSPTPTQVLPSATPSPSATASPTMTPPATATPPPPGSPTSSPTFTRTPTVSYTPSVTPYPIQKDKVITYPNPFRPLVGTQNIVFDTAEDANIKILDLNGQLVIDLPSAFIQAPLGHAVWDGKDKDGRAVAPGLYFAVVRSSKSTHFSRFTVLY